MKLIKPNRVNESHWCRVLGVDLGKTGGMCGQDGDKLRILPMAGTPKDRAADIADYDPKVVVMEKVHSFPGQGSVSTGTLMEGKGVIIGICAAMRIPITWIEPKLWIGAYTRKKSADFKNKDHWKKHLVEIAESILTPDVVTTNIHLTSGMADSFLIWNYYASIVVNERLAPLNELRFV